MQAPHPQQTYEHWAKSSAQRDVDIVVSALRPLRSRVRNGDHTEFRLRKGRATIKPKALGKASVNLLLLTRPDLRDATKEIQ